MDTLRQRIQAHMETICLKFGSRHCGAPGEKQTGEYIEQCFRELGLDVITEQFPARGWRFEDFELYIPFLPESHEPHHRRCFLRFRCVRPEMRFPGNPLSGSEPKFSYYAGHVA